MLFVCLEYSINFFKWLYIFVIMVIFCLGSGGIRSLDKIMKFCIKFKSFWRIIWQVDIVGNAGFLTGAIALFVMYGHQQVVVAVILLIMPKGLMINIAEPVGFMMVKPVRTGRMLKLFLEAVVVIGLNSGHNNYFWGEV